MHNTLGAHLDRLHQLIAALGEGPLPQPDLITQLGNTYPAGDSARRMIQRDIADLRALGIVIERSKQRPPLYTLLGGTPHFGEADLQALALVRQTFSKRHPQSAAVHQMLGKLEHGLTPEQRAIYGRSYRLVGMLEPATDYSGFAELIRQLEEAVRQIRRLAFEYQPIGSAQPNLYHDVESYDLELFERQIYFVGYVVSIKQFIDFRVDRITPASLEDHGSIAPGLAHVRPLVTFRYRLAKAIAQSGLSQRFPGQRIVGTADNGDPLIEAQGRSDFFIIQTLLRYRANAELLAPTELRQKMRDEVQQLAQLYRNDELAGC